MQSNSNILKANNQHRTWRVMIQNLQTQNTLSIYFHSAAKHDLLKQLQDVPFNLPYNYIYSRKAAYHYGWDWRIVSMHVRALKIYEKSVVIEINIETYLINVGTQLKLNSRVYMKLKLIINILQIFQTLNVSDIELWWPIGQGQQKLYQLQTYLVQNESYVVYQKITTSFRIAQWIQEKDGDKTQSFKFRINGRVYYYNNYKIGCILKRCQLQQQLFLYL